MPSFYVAWQYLRFNRFRTATLITCITVILALPVLLKLVVDEANAQLRSRAATTPLLVGAAGWSWQGLGGRRDRIYRPLDLLVVPALVAVALALTQFYQVGRIVAHGAPLFIWPLLQRYASWARRPRI